MVVVASRYFVPKCVIGGIRNRIYWVSILDSAGVGSSGSSAGAILRIIWHEFSLDGFNIAYPLPMGAIHPDSFKSDVNACHLKFIPGMGTILWKYLVGARHGVAGNVCPGNTYMRQTIYVSVLLHCSSCLETVQCPCAADSAGSNGQTSQLRRKSCIN